MYVCYCPLRDLNWKKIYCIVLYCIVLYKIVRSSVILLLPLLYIIFGCKETSEELNILKFKSMHKFIRQICRFDHLLTPNRDIISI